MRFHCAAVKARIASSSMKLPELTEGRLVKRYKRFLADVELAEGEMITALCPNPGSMLGLNVPGAPVWLSWSDNPKRKLPYTWELVQVDGGLVGLNTNITNRLGEEAIEAGLIKELKGYSSIRREVRYGENSRIDLLLEDPTKPPCYVEIKNITLRRQGDLAEFPDSVTKRGAKHLRELTKVVADGGRAVMLYIAQRSDCARLAVAKDIDPAYNEALKDALAAGVEAYCYRCEISLEKIDVSRPIELLRP